LRVFFGESCGKPVKLARWDSVSSFAAQTGEGECYVERAELAHAFPLAPAAAADGRRPLDAHALVLELELGIAAPAAPRCAGAAAAVPLRACTPLQHQRMGEGLPTLERNNPLRSALNGTAG
jgi:hypothetical protein